MSEALMDAVPRTREDPPVLLVVDDETFIRKLLARMLGGTCRVLTAACMDEALQTVSEHRVDAVLTDVAMPGGSGLELAAALLARHPGIPLAFLTGSADDEVHAFSRSISAPLFHKPFDVSDLAGWIGSLLPA